MHTAEIIRPKFGSRAKAQRYRSNAERCRITAAQLTDPQERGYQQNFAKLWDQLAEAADFEQEFRAAHSAEQKRGAKC